MEREKDLDNYDVNDNFFTDLDQTTSTPKGSKRRLIKFFIGLIVVTLILFLVGKILIVKIGTEKFSKLGLTKDFMGNDIFNEKEDGEKGVVLEGSLTPAELALIPVFTSQPYTSLKDPEIEADILTLDEKISVFVSNFNKEKLSGQELLDALSLYNQIQEISSKLKVYSILQSAKDAKNPIVSSLSSRINGALSKNEAAISFFMTSLSRMTSEEIENVIIEVPELSKYKYKLLYFSKYNPHTLGSDVEKYGIRKSLVTNQAWNKNYELMLSRANISIPDVGENLNIASLLNLMGHRDRNIRKKASHAMGSFLDDNIDILSHTYNAIVRDNLIEKDVRGYKSAISMRNLSNDVSDDVVLNLIKSVSESYGSIAYRYYDIKAKLLNLTKMEHFDRNAPLDLGKITPVPFNDAKDMVLNAYSSFSPTIYSIANKFFEEGRIDAKVSPNKESGAFCISYGPSSPSYIIMNYLGSMRDVFTLAHELGHGIHNTLSSTQDYINYSPVLITAEIASIFGEKLLMQEVLKRKTSVTERAQILANKIDDNISVIIRQIAFAKFEHKVHVMSEHKDLTAKELSDIWLNIQRESLGTIFELGEEYGNYWSYISHFFYAPFYVYSYAFAALMADRLYMLYKSGDVNNFEENYINMLSKGSSENYIDLLKPFGLNPESPDFWRDSLSSLKNDVEEFENLVNSQAFHEEIKNIISAQEKE